MVSSYCNRGKERAFLSCLHETQVLRASEWVVLKKNIRVGSDVMGEAPRTNDFAAAAFLSGVVFLDPLGKHRLSVGWLPGWMNEKHSCRGRGLRFVRKRF